MLSKPQEIGTIFLWVWIFDIQQKDMVLYHLALVANFYPSADKFVSFMTSHYTYMDLFVHSIPEIRRGYYDDKVILNMTLRL